MKKLATFAATLALAAALPVQAALVNSITGLTQNFDDAGSYDTSGPTVQIGTSIGLDVRASSGGGPLTFSAPFWALGGNGEWSLGKTYAGVDGDFIDRGNDIAASMFFDIGSSRVRAVGGFLNHDPDFTIAAGGFPLQMYIAAYDFGGNLIEDHFLSISTVGGINEGAFFGISADTDIARFEVSAPYAVIDDLTFRVPEPGTLALMPLALGALALRRRRESQRA